MENQNPETKQTETPKEKWSFKTWWNNLWKKEESTEKTEEPAEKTEEEPKAEKKSNSWIWWLIGSIIVIGIILALVFKPFSKETGKEKEKTEQTDGTQPNQPGGGNTQPGGGNTQPGGGNTQPGGGNTQPGGGNTQPGGTQPIVQIEVPAANGQHNWSNVDQDMLKKAYTSTPDLKGQNVLLVYLVKDYVDPSGKTQDMIWIQTDQGNGPVRNIFTEATRTKTKQ